MDINLLIDISVTLLAALIVVLCAAVFMVRRNLLASPLLQRAQVDALGTKKQAADASDVKEVIQGLVPLKKDIPNQIENYRIVKPPQRDHNDSESHQVEGEVVQYQEYDFSNDEANICNGMNRRPYPKSKRPRLASSTN